MTTYRLSLSISAGLALKCAKTWTFCTCQLGRKCLSACALVLEFLAFNYPANNVHGCITQVTAVFSLNIKHRCRYTAFIITVRNLFFCYINMTGASCTAGDLSMNSKCYRKFDRQLTWYSASNDCLSRGGSLAVFTDIGRPSDNSQLTAWLNIYQAYWIGLIRSWWKTTTEGEFELPC